MNSYKILARNFYEKGPRRWDDYSNTEMGFKDVHCVIFTESVIQ
jgi:hypothetical protein